MACLTPATCHSLTSRYSLSASAARNDRLRPVLLASFSSRLLTSVSTRTVNVVEDIANYLVMACVQITTRHGLPQTANLGRLVDRGRDLPRFSRKRHETQVLPVVARLVRRYRIERCHSGRYAPGRRTRPRSLLQQVDNGESRNSCLGSHPS